MHNGPWGSEAKFCARSMSCQITQSPVAGTAGRYPLLAVVRKTFYKMKAQFEKEQSESGEFRRQEDTFRDWISSDGSTDYPAVADRYHLYISLACPWASRTLIARKLLGLETVIGLTVVDPVRDERGWA